jgi:hypothetical protein
MSDDERIEQSSESIDRIYEFRLSSELTAEERAKLKFALEKHKEALILLSQ